MPTNVHGKCEACDAGGVSCEFRDRERYFAERSRSVTAAATAGSESTSSSSSQRRSSRSPANVSRRSSYGRRSPRSVADASTAPAWYTSTPDHQQGAFASSSSYPTIAPSSSPQTSDWFLGEGLGEGITGSRFVITPSTRTISSPNVRHGTAPATSVSPSTPDPAIRRRPHLVDYLIRIQYTRARR